MLGIGLGTADTRVCYVANQQTMPASIEFVSGGLYQRDSRDAICLVAGWIGTISEASEAVTLYDMFLSEVTRGFVSVKGARLGPEALELCERGICLLTDPSASRKLKLPNVTSPRGTRRFRRLSLRESMELLRQEGLTVRTDQLDATADLGEVRERDERCGEGATIFRAGVTDVDLSFLTMPNTFAQRSAFDNVRFTGSDLSRSYLCWNDWLECDFEGADLHSADLRASIFERCIFRDAVLADADLRYARFDECDFSGADLCGARLTLFQIWKMKLSRTQRQQVRWGLSPGPEPPGG